MGHTLYSPNPIIPYHNSVGQTEVKKFGGLLTSEFMPAPIGRSFQMRQTYRHNVEGPIPDNLRRLIADPRKPKGPPTHFHQFQTEYFKVEEGICIVEINGVPRNVTPDDEEISCKPGNVHAFYIHPDSPEKMTILLSASDTGMDYQLDRVFFENWYGYWHDALLYRGGLDLIQTLQIHDAGDHYTPAPAWMPFRTFFGYWACVIIGRWLGGLLGYKPFFKEYTTDWDFAVSKMKGNFFTRWNVHESYADKPSWEKQVEMSSHPKPTNAEYEELVTDMTETFRSSQREVNGALNGDTVTPLRKRV
ncbi:hypothetical protein BU16DRAFT_546460 [Lophium mytilinum]|uniref:Uncharacterized protein n=1 Tax=Lophium mytilinum TaxID=390894 RepID=A0A6A6R8P0_9PEZI|nr:hypothetical protein BU16DRAFT_546460 [Lophium mytilinum]